MAVSTVHTVVLFHVQHPPPKSPHPQPPSFFSGWKRRVVADFGALHSVYIYQTFCFE